MENFLTQFGIKKINELAIRSAPKARSWSPSRGLFKPSTSTPTRSVAPTVSKKSQDPVKPTMGPPMAAPKAPTTGGGRYSGWTGASPPPPQTPTATMGDLDAVSRGPGRQGDVLGSKADNKSKLQTPTATVGDLAAVSRGPTPEGDVLGSRAASKAAKSKLIANVGRSRPSPGSRLTHPTMTMSPEKRAEYWAGRSTSPGATDTTFPGMKGMMSKSVGPDRTRPPEGAVKPIDPTRADVPMGDKERAVMGMSQQTPSPGPGRGEEKPPASMPTVTGRSVLGKKLGGMASMVRTGMRQMKTQHAKDKELDQRQTAERASKARGEKTGALLPGDPGGPPATPASPPSIFKKMMADRKARAQGIKLDYASNWTPDGEFSLGSSRKELGAKEKSTFGDPTVLTPTQKKMAAEKAAKEAHVASRKERLRARLGAGSPLRPGRDRAVPDHGLPLGSGNTFKAPEPGALSAKERIRARIKAQQAKGAAGTTTSGRISMPSLIGSPSAGATAAPRTSTTRSAAARAGIPRTSTTTDRLRTVRKRSSSDYGDDEQ